MNKKLKEILIIVFWIVIWAALTAVIANKIVLAGPIDVINSLMQMSINPKFWVTVGLSLLRVTIGFVASCIIGCFLAYISYKIKIIYDFINPIIQFAKSAPIVCFIVLLLLWVGSEYVDIITIIITVSPVFFFAIYEALSNRDKNIVNMLKIYKVNAKTSWRIYEWPNAVPYFNQATKTGIGLAWKSGVTAQMIGAVAFTIGEGVFNSKLYLDSAQLLVWMFVVILLSWMIEKLILRLINSLTKQNHKKSICVKEPIHKFSVCSDATIVLGDITKKYNDKKVLEKVCARINSGDRIALTSGTGSGKTTLLNIILELEQPDSGEVFIKDYEPRTFSTVFQETSLLDHLTVNQNISVIANKNHAASLVDGNLLASELSGGMKRCVEIERAIVADSQIVLMDEPFAGLDDKTKDKAINYINNNLNGRTLILSTHNKTDAEKLNCTNLG